MGEHAARASSPYDEYRSGTFPVRVKIDIP
jgi:hypothetical protein